KLNGSHTGQALAWSVWESLSKRGLVHRLYSITGDNAANNSAMINALECKFQGVSITWPAEYYYHRCACHVLNLVAKEFLSFMGELTDEDYKFFDNYLVVHQAPIEDSEDEDSPTTKEIQGK
ncbi:hypothetical protein O181_058730, partial [Austropuccinia psidii MF-1]|nr:hypothetical protein [Austropuccinia psidii MF-1]